MDGFGFESEFFDELIDERLLFMESSSPRFHTANRIYATTELPISFQNDDFGIGFSLLQLVCRIETS